MDDTPWWREEMRREKKRQRDWLTDKQALGRQQLLDRDGETNRAMNHEVL